MNTIDWLLDSDPAIRWQVMLDLTFEPHDVVALERAKVATAGWGAWLLALQGPTGLWAGGGLFPEWTSTTWTLMLLRDLGLDRACPEARRAIAPVREDGRWEHAGQRYFDGEVEPCINGKVVAMGAYFGEDVDGVVERLLGEQMADGGWNCEQENGSVRGSFDTTINVLEGFLEYERATGGSDEVRTARLRGEEYLLERRLLRRLSTGEVIDESYTRFAFPTRWHYDILRGLDHLRNTGQPPDARASDAVELIEGKRDDDGRWSLDHTYPGEVYFAIDDGDGKPSRWNTLRAMRVLDWWTGGQSAAQEAGNDADL